MNETTSRVFLFYEIYSVQSRSVTLETKKKLKKEKAKRKEKKRATALHFTLGAIL
jgi:hypothetical protein